MNRKDAPNQGRESYENMMKENKPIRIKEQPRPIGWEKCVWEYLEKDKERWIKNKKDRL